MRQVKRKNVRSIGSSRLFQPYRHVDNIMFENGNMVNRFLNYWRSSGHQRIGFLYGRYEVYDKVPLGIRAVVSAIYEPPQVNLHMKL